MNCLQQRQEYNPTNPNRFITQSRLDAYGWPHDPSDEEILERLLTLNLEWASA